MASNSDIALFMTAMVIAIIVEAEVYKGLASVGTPRTASRTKELAKDKATRGSGLRGPYRTLSAKDDIEPRSATNWVRTDMARSTKSTTTTSSRKKQE